jgi:hypothetical protein
MTRVGFGILALFEIFAAIPAISVMYRPLVKTEYTPCIS